MLSDIATFYDADPALLAGSAFLLGLVVGSFLNVVIYRLPIMLEREWRAAAAELLAGEAAAPTSAVPATPAVPDTLAVSATPAPVPSPSSYPAPEPQTPGGRLPEAAAPLPRFTLSTPPSACPSCKAPIKAWQNIPLLSWLMLRGRCAACGVKISARYPLVELATGILSAWVAWHFGFGAPAACALIVTWTLIALTGIDVDHQLLPDTITLPLMWAGLLAAVAFGPSGAAVPASPHDALIGAAAGYGSLWLVFHGFRLVTGKEGMGYGDFKLFAAIGAWLGWKLLPLVLILSAATGALLGILLIVLRGRDRSAPMPFGPYLAAAGWLAMMYGDALVTGYLRISGLKH